MAVETEETKEKKIEYLPDPYPVYYRDDSGGYHPYSDIVIYVVIKKLNEVIKVLNELKEH